MFTTDWLTSFFIKKYFIFNYYECSSNSTVREATLPLTDISSLVVLFYAHRCISFTASTFSGSIRKPSFLGWFVYYGFGAWLYVSTILVYILYWSIAEKKHIIHRLNIDFAVWLIYIWIWFDNQEFFYLVNSKLQQ